MKTLGVLVGIVLVLTGAVWFLQGIDVLHGSGMSGDSTWAIVGPVVALVGAGLVVTGLRKKGSPR